MFAASPGQSQSHLGSPHHRRGAGSSSTNSGSPPDLTNGSSPEDDSDVDSRSDQSGNKHPFVAPSALESPWFIDPSTRLGLKVAPGGPVLSLSHLSNNGNGDSEMVDGSKDAHSFTHHASNGATDTPTQPSQPLGQSSRTRSSTNTAGSGSVSKNDEDMFDSLIKEDSFEPAASATPGLDVSAVRGNSISEDRNSAAKRPATKRKGPKPTQAQDELIGYSAHTVVQPSVADLPGQNVQAHVHGIALVGAKSRVETQIRMRLELVRPQSGDEQADANWERIGSFSHIKLPPFTGSKRGSKKFTVSDVPPEKTLFVDATVVRGSPPHERVVVCDSCKDRELRRAVRRKEARSSAKDAPSKDEMLALGIDPNAPDAVERAVTAVELREQERVVVFNCGDYVPFDSGDAILLTRITCYCRHHAEKLGFCIIFTLRDWQGRIVATGSTPPIMIMDDHKANAPPAPSKKGKSKNRSEETAGIDEPSGPTDASTIAKHVKRERERSKPYDVPPTGRQRRATNASATSAASLSMLRSPSQASNAFSPATPDQSFEAVPSPANTEASSRSFAAPAAPAAPHNGTSGLSLHHATLQPDLHSAPDFDFDAFLRSTDSGMPTPQNDMRMLTASSQVAMAASSGQLAPQTFSVPPMAPPQSSNLTTQQPIVHKLIPGEGPTSGGIEVTILGSGFVPGIRCVFGDVAAIETRVWADTTIVALLPPSPNPGPVVVTLKGINGETLPALGPLGLELDPSTMSPPFFTYVDRTDRALMELALQVVGLQMTGQMQSAREVAMRVVGSSSRGGSAASSPPAPGGASDSVATLFAAGVGSTNSFQSSLISFLDLLDVDVAAAVGGRLPAGMAARSDAIRLANSYGQTLLHLAVQLGFRHLVVSLIARGCPVNARDRNGYTALHFAALQGRVTIARLLLDSGARTDVRNAWGRTALDTAAQWDQIDVEELLQSRAVSIEQQYPDDDLSDLSEEEDMSDALESDVDDDNISTSASANAELGYDCEDELDYASTDSEASEGSVDGQVTGADKLLNKAATLIEKPFTSAKGKEVQREKGNAIAEQANALRNWFARAGDTVKLPISRAGALGSDLGSLGMNMHMHMPAVPVFHLQLPSPPRFGHLLGRKDDSLSKEALVDPITGLPSRKNGKGRAADCDSDASDSGAATPRPRRTSGGDQMKEYWKLIAVCKNIVEESALWLNPLYQPLEASPPPAYEPSLSHMSGDGVQLGASSTGIGSSTADVAPASSMQRTFSRFPAIAPPSRIIDSAPTSPIVCPQVPSDWGSDEQDLALGLSEGSADEDWPSDEDIGSDDNFASNDLSLVGSPSSSTIVARRTGVPSRLLAGPSSSPMTNTPTRTAPTDMTKRTRAQERLEDPMLMYFWLPALVVVLVLLLCSGQHSIFSLSDLLSYLPY